MLGVEVYVFASDAQRRIHGICLYVRFYVFECKHLADGVPFWFGDGFWVHLTWEHAHFYLLDFGLDTLLFIVLLYFGFYYYFSLKSYIIVNFQIYFIIFSHFNELWSQRLSNCTFF